MEERSKFIEVKFAKRNDCDGAEIAKSNSGSRAVFKLPKVAFNFHRNTKTLQIQGSVCIGVRNHLEEVVSHLTLKD